MRKVRDYDAELKALGDKARALKAKRVEQRGQLVTATGADVLDAETLAGVLLDAIGSNDAGTKEAWRAKGAAFFQRRGRKGAGAAAIDGSVAATEPGGDAAGGSGGTTNG
jgi:type II secretory pathway component PulK